jgi:DNA repair exonuclease SbcCD ATPase subunit
MEYKKVYPWCKIRKVAHVSDIHFRNIARHEEYKIQLDRFILSIAKQEPDIVVITGDIVHAKTQMSPELVDNIAAFFDRLEEIGMLTVFIPGNHDASLTNLSRLDALSPIYGLNKYKYVHYLKDTGIYGFGNVDFYHFSIFDEEFLEDYIKHPDQINIGLYHGPIAGTTTDTGYTFESGMKAGFFSDLDFVMAGDIHMCQQFSESPMGFYAGSLIQQNYGEDVDKGYLMWDLSKPDDKPELIQIENDSPYITLKSTSGLVDYKNVIGNSPRVRVFYDTLSATHLPRIEKKLLDEYNATEVVFQERDDTRETDTGEEYDEANFYDVALQDKLIREFLKQKFKDLPDDVLDSVIELNHDVEKIILEDPKYNGKGVATRWFIENLKFKNLFTYGEENELDLQSFSGITGILGDNAIGKTSLLEILTYALFGTTSKSLSLTELVNHDKFSAGSEIILNTGSKRYLIQRKIKVARKTNSASQKVVFYDITDNADLEHAKNLTGDDKRVTEKNISEIFGTSSDFLETSIMAQRSWDKFISSKDTARRKTFISFLDLVPFQMKYELANKDNNKNLTLLEDLKTVDHSLALSNANETIRTETSNIADFEADKVEAEELLDTLREEKNLILKKYRQVEKINTTVDIENRTIKHNKNSITTIEQNIQDIKDGVELHKKDVDKLKDKANHSYAETEEMLEKLSAKGQERDKAQKAYEDIKEKLDPDIEDLRVVKNKLKQKLTEAETRQLILTDDMQMLEDDKRFESEDLCSTCQFVSAALKSKKELPELKEKIVLLKAAIVEVEESKVKLEEQLSTAKATYDKLQNDYALDYGLVTQHEEADTKIQKDMNELEAKINKLEADIPELQADIVAYNKLIDACKLKIQNLEKLETDIQFNAKLDHKVVECDGKIIVQDGHLKNIVEWKLEAATELARAEEARDEIARKMERRDELSMIVEVYNYYLTAIHRNGIPANVVNNALSKINLEISKILQGVVDFTTTIVDEEGKINVYVTYPGSQKTKIEGASGMESAMSEIAIRKALLQISMKPKCQVIALDECFSFLHADKIASLDKVFTVLRGSFRNVLVISHAEVFKDFMDQNIEIIMKDRYSYIS